jgi:membrane protease subunit HflC
MRILVIIGVLVIVGLIVTTQSLFTVDETEQVIVTRFGEVQEVRRNPGLYLKVPFVDSVTSYDKRVLRIDAPADSFLDKDTDILEIDVYARYQIVDPIQFRKTLITESTARDVLGNRINSALRAVIATRDREEIIGGKLERDELDNPVVDEAGNTIVEPTESRTEILAEVLAAVTEALKQEPEQFGIVMIDVRVKRADFPSEVANEIFERMRSDRLKIATGLRSEGEEESKKIRAIASRDREVLLANADKESSIRRGAGEAEAIRILAEALQRDPEFFAFRRSLEAYKAFLNERTTVILPADSELFRFLEQPGQSSSTTEGE